jgi:gamma-glutamyltranspeptidase
VLTLLLVLKEGGSAVDSAIATALCIGTINGFSSGKYNFQGN